LKLEDGSVVTLFPQSKIRYAGNLVLNATYERAIFLQGQAIFDVAKDKRRPFTVYAGNIVTTVLGTTFSIHENELGVIVKLYQGKVKIHRAGTDLNTRGKDIFLEAGEQLRFELGTNLAKVSSFKRMNRATKNPDDRIGEQENMVFDHTALTDVMDKLSRYYRTSVGYDKDGLSGMFFSGQVLNTDSLSIILKVIANMNDLKITKTTNGYMVNSIKK
jgi:ferric-dicitrate binding protein FerR (iron transport regulator)